MMQEPEQWSWHRETPEWARHELRKIFEAIHELREDFEELLPGEPVKARLTIEQGEQMADISVRDDNAPLNATVSFVDAKGAAVGPDDVPVWSSSDDTVASVDASADATGLSAVVTIGVPGAAVISVDSTDTDGTVIAASGTVTVTAGEPAAGEVNFA